MLRLVLSVFQDTLVNQTAQTVYRKPGCDIGSGIRLSLTFPGANTITTTRTEHSIVLLVSQGAFKRESLFEVCWLFLGIVSN